ncbi:MAG: aldehyde dehydrogenase family protein [Myxococcota bacterium]
MGKGSFIGGVFVAGAGEIIRSQNPARAYETVFETNADISHVAKAVEAAEKALPIWRGLTQNERVLALKSVEAVFKKREEDLAQRITAEMGKIFTESLFEAKNVSGRVSLTAEEGLKRVATEHPPGAGETRYHAQGIMAVLGPYNFPAHLMNSHIIPALMTGNTIVAKPSELCPGVGELYAECFEEAGLPAGVFNLIQGRGDIGKALVTHPRIRGVLFTGSYQTGRALTEMLLDHPHKILALEMGGKNTAVVLDDADLYQCLVEISQGAFQSAGQRCTATSRVLIDRQVAPKLIPALIRMAKEFVPADPTNTDTVLGPMAGRAALERYLSLLEKVRESAGCKVLLEAQVLPGGAFVTPSVYQVEQFVDIELFGPHFDIQLFDGLDEAIKLVNQSDYGLSNSIFTRSETSFERFYQETYSGVLNWNRSTNGLSGKAPFGGVGKSGNHRPAGIDAVRNATYPVMVQSLPFGHAEPLAPLALKFKSEQIGLSETLEDLIKSHEQEFAAQRYRYFDQPHVPKDIRLPASEVMLQRLYQGDLVPREKKEPIVDLFASKGPYLVSIDEEPLVIFDAASQIASLGLGFSAGPFQKALDEGQLTESLLSNAADISGDSEAYEKLLLSRADKSLNYVSFTTSGAAANEKAFDLCRLNGPGGKRIIAFEGSFHGRTMMALHATYNPEKRKGFELPGYEVTFLPFGSLDGLKEALAKGDMCCVIVEPVQCEGGDNFASIDFFRGVRQITRDMGVPMVVDEVQTGFGLFGPFFYHTAFGLENGPDCVTLAKKAQLGVVLSTWPDTRPEHPHQIQIQKGLIQAKAVLEAPFQDLERQIADRLAKLHEAFPMLVSNPRNTGYAFAFNMPTPAQANHVVNQRFSRGFMVYIAGVQTLRFRANIDTTLKEIDFLFDALHGALKGTAPAKTNVVSQAALPLMGGISIEQFTPDQWSYYANNIEALEHAAYEPERRDSMAYLESWLKQPKSVGLIAKQRGEVVGFAIGGPLEHSKVDGPVHDPMRGLGNTFYSTDIVIHESLRGKGVGYHLKAAQIEAAKKLGYAYMSGRNRVGATSEIQRINKSFGAYTVAVYDHQYGSDAQALYYRIPLLRPALPSPLSSSWRGAGGEVNWADSIQAPLGKHSPEILADIQKGIFTTAVGTKLTLSNFITPDMVRYTELLRHLMPRSCKHLYFTSGRDEMVDKGLRSLKVSRPGAEIAIGLKGQYLGHTTCSARSLTDPGDYQKPFSWFDWPLAETAEDIEALITEHGADKIFGIVIELMGEMTGKVISPDLLRRLSDIREKTGIPLVFVETASSLGRSGESLFLSDSLPVQPNMVWWYSGGQLGHIFTDNAFYVAKPLTLISTWDGDEISMRRAYRHLIVAHEKLQNSLANKFESAISKLGSAFTGKGLWYSWDLPSPEHAQKARLELEQAGLLLAKGFGSKLILCPPVTLNEQDLTRGLEILERYLRNA